MTYSDASNLIDRLDSLLFEKHKSYAPLAGTLKTVVKSLLSGIGDAEHYRKFIENEIKSLEDANS